MSEGVVEMLLAAVRRQEEIHRDLIDIVGSLQRRVKALEEADDADRR